MTLHYQGARGGRQQARGAAPSAGGSALSYRPDSVPGYTGYVPGSQCVPVALHTKVSERAPGATVYRPRVHIDEPGGGVNSTTYGATYVIDPLHNYCLDPRVSRPVAAAAAAPAPAPACAAGGGGSAGPQMAGCKSTYQAEILDHRAASFNRPSGCGGGGGGGGGGSGSGGTAPASPAAAARPGYLTTAAASQLYMMGGQSAWGQSTTSGAGGSMPSVASSTPGPPPAHTAVADAAAACRPSKADAFLHALDQHSRGRLPGYTGHRPQHRVGLELPLPTKLTTWGAASQEALRRPPPPPDATHAINSRAGLLGFFSAGGGSGFVSDNGMAEAARYHEAVRPLEGAMKIPQPSRTTARGAKFSG